MKYAVLAALAALTAGQDQEPQKPQKEHEFLRQFEGEWDVRARSLQPNPEEWQGTESDHLRMGGLWLVFDFKGEYLRQPLDGHGMMTYDPQKKVYMSAWIDSFSTAITRFEGKVDASGKVLTVRSEIVDPKTGVPTSHRMIFEFTDRDHRTVKTYGPGQDGKEVLISEMFYSRKASDAK